MREGYYQRKSANYGIGYTRERKIFELIGSIKNERVLDVGCARGYLGEKIKRLGNYVAGVEISDKAAQEARKVLNRVDVFDIEQDWPDILGGNQFDLVILAEILEHVFDPAEVLKSVYRVLKLDGFAVITTPNFMTWTNRARFLFGNFEYQDQGMFDFGHIRFFTYPYLEKVLKESGFEIIEENHIIFPGKLTPILKCWPGLFATQFVVKAKKL